MVDEVVVEEGELTWRLQEVVAEVEADLVDEVDGLDLVGRELAHAVDVLCVLDVRGRDLRRELAGVLPDGPDGQRDHALAALPDALDGAVEQGDELRGALEHLVVDRDRRRDARAAALRGGAHGEERDHVAAVGVQPEVVVRLLALERRLALHLGLDLTERHAVAARLGAQPRRRLLHDVPHVRADAEVQNRELRDRVALDGYVGDHGGASAVLELFAHLGDDVGHLSEGEPGLVDVHGDVVLPVDGGRLGVAEGVVGIRQGALGQLVAPKGVLEQLRAGPGGAAADLPDLRHGPLAARRGHRVAGREAAGCERALRRPGAHQQ